MTKTALKLCFEAHKDQTDKSGMPYVFHPFHLAEQMSDERTTVVALLHDVIEDTDYALDDLKNMSYSDDILSAIALMTNDGGSFSGYNFVIEIAGQIISPANTFSEDVADAFESNKILIIQYGEMKNDGTYIWSIKVSD